MIQETTTSLAFRNSRRVRKTHRAVVLKLLEERGPIGATGAEATLATGLKENITGAALSKLGSKWLAHKSGRRKNPSGHEADVWVLGPPPPGAVAPPKRRSIAQYKQELARLAEDLEAVMRDRDVRVADLKMQLSADQRRRQRLEDQVNTLALALVALKPGLGTNAPSKSRTAIQLPMMRKPRQEASLRSGA